MLKVYYLPLLSASDALKQKMVQFMSADPKKLLEELSTNFEKEFAEAKALRPRYVKLDEFKEVQVLRL